MNANANVPLLYRCNRPNCQFARPNLVRVTDHIRRKDDHQGTIFGQHPNRPGQCLGVHVATHPAPLPNTGFAYMAIAKTTIDERHGIFNLFTEHDDDAWNGFMDAYVHANTLVSVAGHNFFDENNVTVQWRPNGRRIEGSSGSGTVLCALCSLATGRLCRADTAITARVVAAPSLESVGYLELKAAAARNARVRRLVMSRTNQVNWHALPAAATVGVEPVFVEGVGQLLENVLV
ncbi:hypothetical protein niasHS_004490 [Heterodera schachtii]|uniref:Lon proteolytic domain-containing protein n=1 Tax=Heterodera schachtii TaxID=97005 RepID=A0ABD2JMD4_HETSC